MIFCDISWVKNYKLHSIANMHLNFQRLSKWGQRTVQTCSNLVISHIIGERNSCRWPHANLVMSSPIKWATYNPFCPSLGVKMGQQRSSALFLMANLTHSGNKNPFQPGNIHVTVMYRNHFKPRTTPSEWLNLSRLRKAVTRPTWIGASPATPSVPERRWGKGRKWPVNGPKFSNISLSWWYEWNGSGPMVLCWEDLPVFVNEILRALFLTSLLHG